MKYFTAIATLLGLNLISVITLIYFSGISKEIEKENKILEMQISKFSKLAKSSGWCVKKYWKDVKRYYAVFLLQA